VLAKLDLRERIFDVWSQLGTVRALYMIGKEGTVVESLRGLGGSERAGLRLL
jgi:hypothetical protein